MTPQSVFDAATLIGGAATTLVILVQLLKFGQVVETPRAIVAVSITGGFILTGLYALSNGALVVANVYGLVSAAVLIGAAGAGVHSAATAAITNGSPPPK